MNHRRTTRRAARLFTLVALSTLLPLAAASPVYADGTWTKPLEVPSGRYNHTMASLGGDQVLMFGGRDDIDRSGETWVYDLSDNQWTNKHPDGGAVVPREHQAMAPIGDGRVLMFGGDIGAGYDGETWLYELTTNTWTRQAPIGDTPPGRVAAAAATLGGGQVLLFGGVGAGSLLSDTWVYDLATNIWTPKPRDPGEPVPDARSAHGMAYLGGGQVLLFGGINADGFLSDTWIYDLVNDSWTKKTPALAPSGRQTPGMASLGEGQVLLFGGDHLGIEGDTWIYDQTADSWTAQTPTLSPTRRYEHAMASLGGGHVLLFGGTDDIEYLPATWVYDLDNGWTDHSPGPPARYRHAMASLGGDQALLFGGYNEVKYFDDGWVYDLSGNRWTNKHPTGEVPSARRDHAMVYLGEDQVLLFGGSHDAEVLGDTWVYDLSENRWVKHEIAGPPARFGHAMAYLGGDQVLVFGGYDRTSWLGDTWLYDLSENRWIEHMIAGPPARYFHAMTSLGGGRVLLFGGITLAPDYFADTWVFDGTSNTWTQEAPATSVPTGRYGHQMAYLGMDQVLLFGGYDEQGHLGGSSWVYDLSDDAWTEWSPASAPSARYSQAMASLGPDRVVLFGGWHVDNWFDAETWLATGFLNPYRTYLPLMLRQATDLPLDRHRLSPTVR